MSAIRRPIGQLAHRKAQSAGVLADCADEARAKVGAVEATIDPVSADPAVVLWDEVNAPDQQSGEEPPGDKKTAAPDKALH
jgi:hypothetical protein